METLIVRGQTTVNLVCCRCGKIATFRGRRIIEIISKIDISGGDRPYGDLCPECAVFVEEPDNLASHPHFDRCGDS